MRADLYLAARKLWRERRFAATVALTLSMGIGATTAAFSLTNWILLRPLPGVNDPDGVGVVSFVKRDRQLDFLLSITAPIRAEIEQAAPALSATAGYTFMTLTAANVARSQRAEALFVTPSYFTVLGTLPHRGRLLVADDNPSPKGLPVAVISHDLWRSLYQGDSAVIGRVLQLNTSSVTVVGVAPRGFHGAERNSAVDVWLPSWHYAAVFPPNFAWTERTVYLLSRLRPGATFDQLEQQLQGATIGGPEYKPRLTRGIGVRVNGLGNARQSTRSSLAITATLLLIACSNAANLLLLRGLTQRAQTAMRALLGASRASILRALVAEAIVLAFAGAAGGAALALAMLRALDGMTFGGSTIRAGQVPMDVRVLLFAIGISLTAALCAVLAPALLALRTPAMDAVRSTGRSATSGGSRVRKVLAVVQFALSVTLVVGAALFIRTLRHFHGVNLGFAADGLSVFSMAPRERGYSDAQLAAYHAALLERIRLIPDVQDASVSSSVPFAGGSAVVTIARHDASDFEANALQVATNRVSPKYFQTLGTPFLAGRTFFDAEILAPTGQTARVAIANEALARNLFGEPAEALGRRLRLRTDSIPIEIVGVVADSRWTTLGDIASPAMGGPILYGPYSGGSMGRATILTRSRLPLARLAPIVRRVAAEADPSIPIFEATTMQERIERTTAGQRFFARALSFLSLAALLITTVGLYGTVAYDVERRQRELGIRIALGARPGQIIGSLTRGTVGLAVVGVAMGVAGAGALGKLVQSQLHGVTPFDAPSYMAGAAAVLLTAVLASILPARRATRIEPAIVLRAE